MPELEPPAYDPEKFPPNEFVEHAGLLYPHATWLDALNTAGLQLVAERARGTPRKVGRALQALLTPEAAKLARARARDLMLEHFEGLRPEDAPDGWRVVGVVDA